MSTLGDTLDDHNAHKPAGDAASLLQSAGAAVGDAAGRLSEAAQAAGREAKDAASGLAAEAKQNVKSMLDNQLSMGADLAGHVAAATRKAADHLAPNAPQLAGMVRTAASTVDDFSGTLRDRSVEDLFQEAAAFTRRQPAAVFGAAALAGFFMFRVLKVDGGRTGNGTGSGQPTGSGERNSPSVGPRYGA